MRLLALVGFMAYAVDRGIQSLLWFIPYRLPGALLLAALLAFGAWQSASATRALEASLARPVESSVREIVRGDATGWLTIEAVVSGPHLDNRSEQPEPTVLRYYYVLRDPGAPDVALVARSVRSAAQLGVGAGPVELTGVLAVDRFRMREALDDTPLTAALEGLEYPADILFAEGSAPIQPEISYVPAAVLGAAAAFLAVGRLIGYPIFRRQRRARAPQAHMLARGEELALEISGRVPSPHGPIGLDREAGYLSRMAVAEAVRKEWQYWGQPLTELTPALREAIHDLPDRRDPGRLMLHAGGGSALVALESPEEPPELAGGEMVTVAASRPAIRLRSGTLNAILSFESVADRDRAWVELDPRAERLPAPARAAEPSAAARAAEPRTRAGWALKASIGFLALTGLALVGAGAWAIGSGLVTEAGSGEPGAALVPGAPLIGIGLVLAATADGLRRRREWARVAGLNLAVAGMLVAALGAYAQSTCPQQVGPTLTACEPGNAVGVGLALVAVAGFAFSAWAILRLRDRFAPPEGGGDLGTR